MKKRSSCTFVLWQYFERRISKHFIFCRWYFKQIENNFLCSVFFRLYCQCAQRSCKVCSRI